MKQTLLGVLLAGVAGALAYFVQPEVLSGIVAANPRLAVAVPVVTLLVGWLLPQLKVWGASPKKADEAPK